MGKSRKDKLESFLKDIKSFGTKSISIKSFSIEEFEQGQKKIRNRNEGKNK